MVNHSKLWLAMVNLWLTMMVYYMYIYSGISMGLEWDEKGYTAPFRVIKRGNGNSPNEKWRFFSWENHGTQWWNLCNATQRSLGGRTLNGPFNVKSRREQPIWAHMGLFLKNMG